MVVAIVHHTAALQSVADLGVEGQAATVYTAGHCSHWKFIKESNQLKKHMMVMMMMEMMTVM